MYTVYEIVVRFVYWNCLCCLDVCRLPEDQGPCRSYMRRWRYDPRTGYCTQFVYGGCEGNGNQFETEAECRQKCNARPPTGEWVSLKPEQFLVKRSPSKYQLVPRCLETSVAGMMCPKNSCLLYLQIFLLSLLIKCFSMFCSKFRFLMFFLVW